MQKIRMMATTTSGCTRFANVAVFYSICLFLFRRRGSPCILSLPVVRSVAVDEVFVEDPVELRLLLLVCREERCDEVLQLLGSALAAYPFEQ